jgi:protein-tyrosine phosphatase
MPGAAVPDESATGILVSGLENLCAEIERGAHVVVHCSAGIHRTGMIAYALLRMLAIDPNAAVGLISQSRPVTADGLVPARLEWAEATARRHHRGVSAQAGGSGHIRESS